MLLGHSVGGEAGAIPVAINSPRVYVNLERKLRVFYVG
jgi:hypothetical protein